MRRFLRFAADEAGCRVAADGKIELKMGRWQDKAGTERFQTGFFARPAFKEDLLPFCIRQRGELRALPGGEYFDRHTLLDRTNLFYVDADLESARDCERRCILAVAEVEADPPLRRLDRAGRFAVRTIADG